MCVLQGQVVLQGCFLFFLPRPNQWMHSYQEQRECVGSAEWKTSDFVVALIKEQQVPVCLSAQAVLFSLRLLQPAWLFILVLTEFNQQQQTETCLKKCT